MRFNKAQVKMGETIMVLFIFFILIVFGLIFYAKLSSISAQMQKQEGLALSAVEVEQRTRFMGEIQCTSGGTVIFDCYDLGKLEAFGNVYSQNIGFYNRMFSGVTNISITQVYPTKESLTIYSKEYNGTSAKPFWTPVSLFDPIEDTYNFGYIYIEVTR